MTNDHFDTGGRDGKGAGDDAARSVPPRGVSAFAQAAGAELAGPDEPRAVVGLQILKGGAVVVETAGIGRQIAEEPENLIGLLVHHGALRRQDAAMAMIDGGRFVRRAIVSNGRPSTSSDRPAAEGWRG